MFFIIIINIFEKKKKSVLYMAVIFWHSVPVSSAASFLGGPRQSVSHLARLHLLQSPSTQVGSDRNYFALSNGSLFKSTT